MDTVMTAALNMAPTLIADRRWLHANPEVGFELDQTVRYVSGRLRGMGLEPRETGPSALTVTIGKGDRTLLLRARHGCPSDPGDHGPAFQIQERERPPLRT